VTFADRINPAILKELRQAVRSRAILASIGAFLAVLFISCLFTVSAAAKSKTPETYGAELFAWLRGVCSFVVTVIIPFMVMNRTAFERQGGASGVLGLTLLTPSQWADGKAVSATISSGMFTAATLPFATLAYLLRGLDLSKVLLFPPLFLALAFLFNYLAVLFGSFRINALCKRVFFCGVLMLGYISQFRDMGPNDLLRAFLNEILGAFHRPTAALAVSVIVFGCVLASLLFRSAAIARLSPPNFNFRSGVRRTVLIVVLVMFTVFGLAAWRTGDNSALFAFSVMAFPAFLALAFFESALPAGYSRRVRAEIAPSRLRRATQYLFFTGSENGLVFAILLQFFILAIFRFAAGGLAKTASGLNDVRDATACLASLACYINAAILFIRVLWHAAFRHHLRSLWVPIAAFAVLAANSLTDLLFRAASGMETDSGFWFGSIVSVFVAASDDKDSVILVHLVSSAITFLVAFLLFLPLLVRSIRDFRPQWGRSRAYGDDYA
jgi:hypothetical protein